MELKSLYPVKLNLLPTQLRVTKTPNWVRLIFTVILIALSTFTGYAFAMLNVRVDLVNTAIGALEQELTHLREQDRRMQELQREISRIEARVTILKDLVLSEPEWLKMIEAIGASMPANLYLEEASFDRNRISVSGNSFSIFSLAQFIDALSGYRNFFRSADFQSLSLRDGLYFFNLSLELQQS